MSLLTDLIGQIESGNNPNIGLQPTGTIGGIYQYMSTNMPADHPGKMSDEDYADLMAFLLYTNGYDTGSAKLTAQAAQASTTPLNAGPRH